MQITESGVPRRNRMDLWTSAELAIYHAMQAVERLPGHPFLTEAVVLLGQAKDRVADFVESVPVDSPGIRAVDPRSPFTEEGETMARKAEPGPENFRFSVGDDVRVYVSLRPGRVVSRRWALDPLNGEEDDLYAVRFEDGSQGELFGRELEVLPLFRS